MKEDHFETETTTWSGGEDRFTIRLFGPLLVEHTGRRLGPRDFEGVKPKQVLEILVAERGHAVPKDRLAERLWGEGLPENVARTLETYVSVLRRRLDPEGRRGHELVVTEPEAYRFAVDRADVDLDRFDELTERASRSATSTARRCLEQALALVRGEVLEDEPYADWAEPLRGAYRARVLGALLDAADAALAQGDHPAALAHSEAAMAMDRFSERAHRTAMIALYAQGRQHEALDAFQRCRTLLDDELGLEPTPETKAVQAAVLSQEHPSSLLPRPVSQVAVGAGEPRIPLLGRSRELRTLERGVERALDRSFALLVVEGEAGVGKTRLLDEVVEALVSRLEGVRVGRARCSELEQHLPYVPLATALREAFGDVSLEPGARLALAPIMPELRLDEPETGTAGEESFRELDALEHAASLLRRHAPLVLVLEDLQWADAGTTSALAYLQRRCADAGVAVLGAVRPEEVAPEHPLRRLEPAERIRLEPLTAPELEPLGIPGLYERTGGHPGFVAAAVGDAGATEVPVTLEEALLARFRSESPFAQQTLVAASVLGQPFEPGLVAVLLGADPAEITEELDRLCARRLLRAQGIRFRFHYDVMREVLSQSLSPARRRLLRERAARAGAKGSPKAGPAV